MTKDEEGENLGKLQECDLCHDIFLIWDLELAENGRNYYCIKCRKNI